MDKYIQTENKQLFIFGEHLKELLTQKNFK